MLKGTDYTKEQAEFYDSHPSIVPWPDILANFGLSILYKPREVFWKKCIDNLDIKRAEKVLDIGSGLGVMLARLRRTYEMKGFGIDVSRTSISFAREHFGSEDLVYKVADAEKLPFPDSHFDVVVSFDALEHIKNQNKVLEEVVRVLRPGGRCLIYTMNRNYEFTLDWVWEVLGFDIFKRAAHKKELFIDPNSMKEELMKRGMKIKKLTLFDSFFTLALDELIMVSVIVLNKFKLNNSNTVGRAFLCLANIISRSFYPIFVFLDRPWVFFGKSLSFCMFAEKQ